jgi:hypothetical protein
MIARTKMPNTAAQKIYDLCRDRHEMGGPTVGSSLNEAFRAGLAGQRNCRWMRGSMCWAAYHAGRDIRGERIVSRGNKQ